MRNIQLQTGRTGRVIPVAVFDPIQLAGTRVERATLNNANFIKTLDIRIGDTIVLHKSGDIIPKITMVELEKRPADAVPYDMQNRSAPFAVRLSRPSMVLWTSTAPMTLARQRL